MDKIPKILSESIDILATKFGSTGIHLYQVMVQGTFAANAVYVGLGAAIMLLGFIMWGVSYKMFKVDEEVSGTYAVLGAFAFIIGAIIIAMNLAGVLLQNTHY